MKKYPASRDVIPTLQARVKKDRELTKLLLDEATVLFLQGDPETAKAVLREIVNATLGFEKLATCIQAPSKSLHRMLSPTGNPTMSNLSAIFAALIDHCKLIVTVRSRIVSS